MKVMDVSVDEKECSGIEMVTPPRKKMKQAQLPFQMISPSRTPEIGGNKKRKLESPSPVDKNATKNRKSTNTSNSAKRVKASDNEVIAIDLESCNENMTDEQSYKSKTTEKQKSVVDHDQKVSEEDAKENLQFEATNGEKRKDCRPLNVSLKESQSADANDDIQLLATKNLESGNSEDSDVSLKPKAESLDSAEKSDQSLEESNKENRETVTPGSVVTRQDVQTQNDITQSTNETVNPSLSVETKDAQVNNVSVEQQKKIVSSDGSQNLDSDSDAVVSSSDDDPDDEPEKSSNETGDKEKSQNENVGDKTPKSVKSHSSTMLKKKLTPKQIERRLEITKKRDKKQQLKMEKQKQREEKQKEKEMKEMKRQNEIKQKQKEKEAKEEERRKKEEERRKKEEERRKKEEEKLETERKKQKAASNFANFFVPKKQDTRVSEQENLVKIQHFMPFEVKMDMRVAPITRRNLEQDEKSALDNFVTGEMKSNGLYLDLLKENSSVIRNSGKTWPNEAKDDVVIIDEAEDTSDMVEQCPGTVEKHRPKFLMFAENRRPPFWGTWRKKSNQISAKSPFVKDPKWFDYEVDSDDEWEEEEPGESIRGSDDEREDDGADDNEYDVDNDFMVPHGYLSDEEAKADEEDGDATSPETQKMKLKLLGEQFEAERKTQTSRIQPRVIGCVWQGSSNDYPENTPQRLVQILTARQAWVRDIPISLPTAATTETFSSSVEGSGRKKTFPEDAIPNLIRLVHGNNHSRIFLMKEFMAFWIKNKTDEREISKVSVSQKIREIATWIACPEEGPMHMKSCWYVREQIRNKYNCTDVTLPNRWTYTLPPTRRSDIAVSDTDKPEKQEKKRVPLITQFTKKITQEEKQKQLSLKPGPVQPKPPKRVALISVPRGERFDKPIVSGYFSKITNPSNDKTGVVEEPKAADGNKQLSISKHIAEIGRIDKVETTAEETKSRERTIIDLSSDNEDTEMNETKENLVGSECSNKTAIADEAKSPKTTEIKPETRQKFEPEPVDSSQDCIVLN